jgi:hypothetical protein
MITYQRGPNYRCGSSVINLPDWERLEARLLRLRDCHWPEPKQILTNVPERSNSITKVSKTVDLKQGGANSTAIRHSSMEDRPMEARGLRAETKIELHLAIFGRFDRNRRHESSSFLRQPTPC